MKPRCEVPTCTEPAVEVLAAFGPGGSVQSVSMCATHAEEWSTPVEPAPAREVWRRDLCGDCGELRWVREVPFEDEDEPVARCGLCRPTELEDQPHGYTHPGDHLTACICGLAEDDPLHVPGEPLLDEFDAAAHDREVWEGGMP